jgi:hypothetical protein
MKYILDERNFTGKVAYFFESGCQHQSQANAILKEIAAIDDERRAFRYLSHSFVDKIEARPVQTGDILSWQTATDQKRLSSGKRRRADFSALTNGTATCGRIISNDEVMGFRKFWSDRPEESRRAFHEVRRGKLPK